MIDGEEHLIRLAQQGDAEACTALYDRHYDAVYRYCTYRVSDVGLAQDLTGEVFVRMVDKLDTFKVRGRPLLAWLYTIARNLVADTHRQNGKATHLPLDSASELISSGYGDPVRRAERRIQAECLAAATPEPDGPAGDDHTQDAAATLEPGEPREDDHAPDAIVETPEPDEPHGDPAPDATAEMPEPDEPHGDDHTPSAETPEPDEPHEDNQTPAFAETPVPDD